MHKIENENFDKNKFRLFIYYNFIKSIVYIDIKIQKLKN